MIIFTLEKLRINNFLLFFKATLMIKIFCASKLQSVLKGMDIHQMKQKLTENYEKLTLRI